MPAQTIDLNGSLIVEQGARWEVILEYEGDLLGAFAKGQIRKSLDGDLIAAFQFDDFVYDEDTNLSTTKMLLRSGTTQLMALPPQGGNWVYDVLIYPRGQDPVRVLQGRVFVSAGVTE